MDSSLISARLQVRDSARLLAGALRGRETVWAAWPGDLGVAHDCWILVNIKYYIYSKMRKNLVTWKCIVYSTIFHTKQRDFPLKFSDPWLWYLRFPLKLPSVTYFYRKKMVRHPKPCPTSRAQRAAQVFAHRLDLHRRLWRHRLGGGLWNSQNRHGAHPGCHGVARRFPKCWCLRFFPKRRLGITWDNRSSLLMLPRSKVGPKWFCWVDRWSQKGEVFHFIPSTSESEHRKMARNWGCLYF